MESPLFQAANITLRKQRVKEIDGLGFVPVELDPTS